ncbi:MAG: hypothetical protein AB7Y46_11380 [Armatimonadota bacterium]
MAYLIAALLGALGVVLLARLLVEWRRYVEGNHLITRPQMILRVISAVDLVLLLVLIAAGARVGFGSAEAALAYWGLCLLLAFAAIALAAWDLLLVRRGWGRRRAESFRRLSVYIRRLEQSRPQQVSRT